MFITPNWPVPLNIKSLCTTRLGGVSLPPFDSFNIATHVGDNLGNVLENRQRLRQQARLPSEPFWLDQQHTNIALELNSTTPLETLDRPVADASWTTEPGLVSLVMTADCLPVLITNQAGSLVAAIHAGWKGLQQGVITETISKFVDQRQCDPSQLLAWIGPAISAQYFEVGQDVLDAFVVNDTDNSQFFRPIDGSLNKYLADLPGLAKKELNGIGVTSVYGGDLCTYAETEQFFSYRRSGQTGRIASLIWIEAEESL